MISFVGQLVLLFYQFFFVLRQQKVVSFSVVEQVVKPLDPGNHQFQLPLELGILVLGLHAGVYFFRLFKNLVY